jgi:hypothetical protein
MVAGGGWSVAEARNQELEGRSKEQEARSQDL